MHATTPHPSVPSLSDAVAQTCAILDAADEGIPSLRDLAARVGVTPDSLRRAFRRELGVSPHAYADARRVERLRGELRRARDVTGAVYSSGYGSSSRVYEHAHAKLGMTPGDYRAGGAGVRVIFAVVPCPLGQLLVASTDVGVCRVMIGDDAGSLETSLRDELPDADVVAEPTGALEPVVREVLARLDGHAPTRELPLDVRGTAFQRRVWQELQRIPVGETRTYGEVAAGIGAPRASRAVGSACAANPVAVMVPCHRVVPASGGVGNYAWGPDRKRRLLAAEAAPTST